MDYISYVQRMSANTTLTDNNGRLYLFANERFFFMYHSGTACIGSYSGSGGEGVFEIDRANLQDTTPSHFWMNSYLATGANNANYYYMISPVRTFSKTGITASYYNRFCTPVGA